MVLRVAVYRRTVSLAVCVCDKGLQRIVLKYRTRECRQEKVFLDIPMRERIGLFSVCLGHSFIVWQLRIYRNGEPVRHYIILMCYFFVKCISFYTCIVNSPLGLMLHKNRIYSTHHKLPAISVHPSSSCSIYSCETIFLRNLYAMFFYWKTLPIAISNFPQQMHCVNFVK